MPWCPNCKTEYREGITHCADCKAELVATIDTRAEKLKNATAMVVKVDGNQEAFAQKFADFLEYSKIPATIEKEKDGMLAVYTDPQDFNTAKRLFKAFYSVESERIQKAAEEAFLAGQEVEEAFFAEENGETGSSNEPTKEEFFPEEDDEEEVSEQNSEKRYGSAVSRYEDYRSSGSVFTSLGIFGVIFAILNLCGVFSIFNTFSTGVLLVFFGFFLGMGIYSYWKAGKLKESAETEKELVENIKLWLAKNITEDALEAFDEVSVKTIATEDDETLARTEDLLYLNRIDGIREAVVKLFPEINPSLAEQLVEEYYAEHFEVSSEIE